MEEANHVNAYTCEKCGRHTFTVTRDAGTTPFMIGCRANNVGCGGVARSNFGAVPPDYRPDWEWVKLDGPGLDAEAAKHGGRYAAATRGHAAKGGLFLRKLDAAGRERYGHKTRSDGGPPRPMTSFLGR